MGFDQSCKIKVMQAAGIKLEDSQLASNYHSRVNKHGYNNNSYNSYNDNISIASITIFSLQQQQE